MKDVLRLLRNLKLRQLSAMAFTPAIALAARYVPIFKLVLVDTSLVTTFALRTGRQFTSVRSAFLLHMAGHLVDLLSLLGHSLGEREGLRAERAKVKKAGKELATIEKPRWGAEFGCGPCHHLCQYLSQCTCTGILASSRSSATGRYFG